MKRALPLAALLLAALFQIGALAKMVTDRAALMRSGQEVLLETGFVDPRDLFRGHYVTLNLVISRPETNALPPLPPLDRYDPVWAELTPGEDGFWQIAALHAAVPDTSAPVLRGTYFDTWNDRVTIDFPIDRYFAPKLRAQELETYRRDNRLGVILALSPTGEAAVKGISIDGTPIYEEPLY